MGTWERRLRVAERASRRAHDALVRVRRRIPALAVPDCTLRGAGNRPARLSALFGRRRELILVHNMGTTCPYCTMWADGFNGLRAHLEDRAAFAVCSPDPPAKQARFATSRGWTFRMVSAAGSDLTQRLGFAGEDWVAPGVSILRKDARGRITRVANASFGPYDEFCGAWHFFELLPGGTGNWGPRFRYPKRG